MNSKHRQSLDAIFTLPVSSSIRWKDIESLLRSIGCRVEEGRGSRVRVYYGQKVATFHRPHPSPETDKGAVKAVRQFLLTIGVKP